MPYTSKEALDTFVALAYQSFGQKFPYTSKVALDTSGALFYERLSQKIISPTLARWCRAYLGSRLATMFKLAKSLIGVHASIGERSAAFVCSTIGAHLALIVLSHIEWWQQSL